jgi:hypothetical protein
MPHARMITARYGKENWIGLVIIFVAPEGVVDNRTSVLIGYVLSSCS